MSFEDTKKRVWTFEITCDDVFRIDSDIGIDITDIEQVIDTLGKPKRFLQLCFALGKAEARDIDFNTFAQGFVGDTIEAAQAELWRALEVFSPSGRKALIANLAAKIKAKTESEIAEAEVRLESFGSLPEESESTPGPSPIDS